MQFKDFKEVETERKLKRAHELIGIIATTLPVDKEFDDYVNQTLSNLYKGSKRKL